MFSTEDYFTEHTNITTKLKLQLFTKVIKVPSEEAWVWYTESLIKSERKRKRFNLELSREVVIKANIDNQS